MNKPKVLIGRSVSDEVQNYIGKFCDYEKWEKEGAISQNLLLEKMHDKEGLLLTGNTIDEELLKHALKLRGVSNMSVGYNNFNLNAMKARSVINKIC